MNSAILNLNDSLIQFDPELIEVFLLGVDDDNLRIKKFTNSYCIPNKGLNIVNEIDAFHAS